jgi:hypothetical protein
MGFVVAQKLFGATNDGAWQSGELGSIDTVTFLRGSGADLVKENKIASLFVNLHIKILKARQEFSQFGQFVVVRREERFRADTRMIVYVFENGASDSQTVIGRSASPQFVQENQ